MSPQPWRGEVDKGAHTRLGPAAVAVDQLGGQGLAGKVVQYRLKQPALQFMVRFVAHAANQPQPQGRGMDGGALSGARQYRQGFHQACGALTMKTPFALLAAGGGQYRTVRFEVLWCLRASPLGQVGGRTANNRPYPAHRHGKPGRVRQMAHHQGNINVLPKQFGHTFAGLSRTLMLPWWWAICR